MMRGRFAPTPSGRMHIGNVYAMLAAWLSARRDPSGTIALRIEDVDVPRVMPDADRWIMDDLAWLGLDWDGAPVYQSRRGDLYRKAYEALRQQGLRDADAGPNAGDDGCGFPLVYPCFCSRADIRAASAPQEGDGFTIYPGTCRRRLCEDPGAVRDRLRRGDRHVWRIAMPERGCGEARITFDDRVFGEQRFDLSRDVGDSVLLRSDGLFSYQLAVVVDDLLMGVDDIVRGRDLLRSTALQTWIRRRLLQSGFAGGEDARNVGGDIVGDAPDVGDTRNARDRDACDGDACEVRSARDARNGHDVKEGSRDERRRENERRREGRGVTADHQSPANPAYAHLPLVRNVSGRRLAKRTHSCDIGSMRDDGVHPEQIIGYCAWMMGLRESGQRRPIPMRARDALALFSWQCLRRDTGDRVLNDATDLRDIH